MTQLKAILRETETGGTDLGIVNAAKVSFSRMSTEIGEGEISLLNFLARGCSSAEWSSFLRTVALNTDPEYIETLVNQMKDMAKHWTPFAHSFISFTCSAPVPIRTQMFKHKAGFVENEESRRYITSRPEIYIPEHFRSATADKKQGSLGIHPKSEEFKEKYVKLTTECVDTYVEYVKHTYKTPEGDVYRDHNKRNRDDEIIQHGIGTEQARFILPQGAIVNWVWSGNLASYARYYKQRVDSHAQAENWIIADQISTELYKLFPHSWKALVG